MEICSCATENLKNAYKEVIDDGNNKLLLGGWKYGLYATVDFGDCNPRGGCDMRGPGIRNIHEGINS
jgi:hypothetical protein